MPHAPARGLTQELGQGSESCEGDASMQATLGPALEGIRVAFTTAVHEGHTATSPSRTVAPRNFADAARTAGVARSSISSPRRARSTSIAAPSSVGTRPARSSAKAAFPLSSSAPRSSFGAGSTSFELVRSLTDGCRTDRSAGLAPWPTDSDGDVVLYLLAAIDLHERTGLGLRDRWERPGSTST